MRLEVFPSVGWLSLPALPCSAPQVQTEDMFLEVNPALSLQVNPVSFLEARMRNLWYVFHFLFCNHCNNASWQLQLRMDIHQTDTAAHNPGDCVSDYPSGFQNHNCTSSQKLMAAYLPNSHSGFLPPDPCFCKCHRQTAHMLWTSKCGHRNQRLSQHV